MIVADSRLETALSNFLAPEFREGQRTIIEQAVAFFDQGRRVVMVQAPVGSGKSIPNYALARAYPRAIITTPQRALIDQLAVDPYIGKQGVLKVLKGRSNYPCFIDQQTMAQTTFRKGRAEKTRETPLLTAAEAKCVRKSSWASSNTYEQQCAPNCEYLNARWDAQASPVAATTFQYLLSEGGRVFGPAMQGDKEGEAAFNKKPQDEKIALLIIDEAHGIESVTSSIAELKLAEYTIHGWDDMQKEHRRPNAVMSALETYRWIVAEFMPILRERFLKMQVDLETLDSEPPKSRGDFETRYKASRALVNLGNIITKIDRLAELEQSPHAWVHEWKTERFWGHEDRLVLSFRPVFVGRLLQRELWWRCEKILLTSGTIIKPEQFLWDIGLSNQPWGWLDLPMMIPAEQRPIFVRPVGEMNRENQEKTLDKMLDVVEEICASHKTSGIIHAHSYKIAKAVGDQLGGPFHKRVIYHTSEDRDEKLKEFKAAPEGAIFVSVSFGEGIDLPDDLARWAIIMKTPFPNIGDAVVKARLEEKNGRPWYNLQTARSIQQMVGRHVRGPQDHGDTFILDASFVKFYRNNPGLFLPWFREGLLAGGFAG